MDITEVAKLGPVSRFEYWVKERHAIYLRRKAGQPKPWTDDEILRQYFFTNPYRENDRVTKWFRDAVREPLRTSSQVLFATVAFRWFNLPETGVLLMGSSLTDPEDNLLLEWNEVEAVKRLTERWQDGRGQVFTGAYMIKAENGPRGSKIPSVCSMISHVWAERQRLVDICLSDCRLQALWTELCKLKGLGGFMSYEVVCDLRYTYLLENATDKFTWCNQGPGAIRGLNRILGRDLNARIDATTWSETTGELLSLLQNLGLDGPLPEMREVEHSLCEYDKMERALDLHVRGIDNGRLKRRYAGT